MNARSDKNLASSTSLDEVTRSLQAAVKHSQALLATSWELEDEAHATLVAAQKVLKRMASAQVSMRRCSTARD